MTDAEKYYESMHPQCIAEERERREAQEDADVDRYDGEREDDRC